MINISVAYFVVICLLTSVKSSYGVIGMNWGRVGVQRLIPSMVVDLLLQNGVQHARIQSSEPDILQAFCGSGINLTIGIFDIFALPNATQAAKWVQKNVPYYGPANIRRVYIGNFVFKYGFHNQTFRDAGVRTLTLVQEALNAAGYDHIKASMPHTSCVLKGNITRPSEAEFKDEIMADMKKVLRVLLDNNAPFVVEIFPAFYVHENNMDPEFAFPDNNNSSLIVTDVNGAVYTNVFDFLYDSYVWALEKAGAGNLEVIAGQVGWPTDGVAGADSAAAERFFKSFLPRVVSNKGTPKRPGRPIDSYLQALTDETKMPEFEPWCRHWGIYRANGEPKYKIDLSGQGRDIFPARAKGIMRMPNRWCVFNGSVYGAGRAKTLADQACEKADCTSLAPGGSCSQLDFTHSISYQFNMYFQSMFQDEDACKFEGFGKVVTDNPSTGDCVFPVEVVRGRQKEFEKGGNSDELRMPRARGRAFFVLLLSIHWAFF